MPKVEVPMENSETMVENDEIAMETRWWRCRDKEERRKKNAEK